MDATTQPAPSSDTEPVKQRRHWLRNAPIATKLSAMVLVFIAASGLFAVMVAVALVISESVRDYVVGEGLWSKSQKDAVIALSAYVVTSDDEHLDRYRQAIARLEGIHRGRLEMEKAEFDPQVVHEGFLLGGMRSEDARNNMIRLYRCCAQVGFFADAVALWIEGEQQLARLVAEAEPLIERMQQGRVDERFRRKALAQINQINDEVTEVEQEFSFVIHDGAELVHKTLIVVLGISSLVLLAMALWVSRRISRYLLSGTRNLRSGLQDVGTTGEYRRIAVLSQDELGDLARTFNEMVDYRRQSAEALAQEQERLKQAEKRFRQIVETTPVAMLMADARGHIVLVNKQFEQLLGYERSEVIGKPVEILLPWESREGHPALRAKYLKAPEVRIMARRRGIHALAKNNRQIPVEVSLSPLRTADGLFVMATLVDMSELRQG